jgi:hypothetical protein
LCLSGEFPDRWVGRRGQIPLLPCFLAITPIIFFFSGFVKDTVCQEKVQNVNELHEQTVERGIKCATKEIFAIILQETLPLQCKQLHECLKMYQFLLSTW